jgi:hypothetical protein
MEDTLAIRVLREDVTQPHNRRRNSHGDIKKGYEVSALEPVSTMTEIRMPRTVAIPEETKAITKLTLYC